MAYQRMDLTKFHWPVLKDSDIIFSTLDVDPKLLEEAQRWGFDKEDNPYNQLAGNLFAGKGRITFKENLNPMFKERATRYLRALMHSFAPKHEHKEAVCALILSELVEV